MEFFKKKLANGLTVLFEKIKSGVVSSSASIKFGGAYESEEIKGISHFMEHLMFKGTKTRTQEEIAREIEKKGGILNAYTSEEVTSYWTKLPGKYFQEGIEITSDLILNPKFDAVEFEKEKGVIIEEIRMYHDNPLIYAPDKIKELLYKKPFGMSIAGKEEIIRGLSREKVMKLFDSVYTTDSMILSVVGNVDFGEICKLAEKFPVRKRKIIEHNPIKINSELVEKRKNIEQAHFITGFHAPSQKDVRRYDYETAGNYLFDGMSSRLFQEIREKRGLAYSVRGGFDLGTSYGYGTIYVGTMKENILKVREIILKEIANLKNINKKDFDESKEQMIGARKVAEEDSSNVMNALMMEEATNGAEEYYKYEERINAVKLEDVRNVSKIKDFSFFSLVPE